MTGIMCDPDNSDGELPDFCPETSPPTVTPAPTQRCTDRTDKWEQTHSNGKKKQTRRWCSWAADPTRDTLVVCSNWNLHDHCPVTCENPCPAPTPKPTPTPEPTPWPTTAEPTDAPTESPVKVSQLIRLFFCLLDLMLFSC